MSLRTHAKWCVWPAFIGFFLLGAGCAKKEQESRVTAAVSASASAASPAAVAPSPEACNRCELAGPCAELSKGCSVFNGDERDACQAVDHCLDTSGCARGDKSFTSCFCGSLATDACLSAPAKGKGAPDGVCAEVIRTAMGAGASTNREILVRFQKPEYPGGAAITRRNCQKTTACRALCGF